LEVAPMPRLNRGWVLLLSLGMIAVVPLWADEPKKPDAEGWLHDRALTLTPRTPPIPALGYHLFPLASERQPGNAAPIYLRLAHERSDAYRKELHDRTAQWVEGPLDRLHEKEVADFLKNHRYTLRQMDLAARRQSCDWAYTLDAGDVIGLLLPDVAELRAYLRLLAVKARHEAAAGKTADAVRTLETAFSFCQQLTEAPFLINSLVALAGVNQTTDALADLLERPEMPNLYWALTTLPRPLIDLRRALEFEQRVPEIQFPVLATLDRERSPEQWQAAYKQLRIALHRMATANPPVPLPADTPPTEQELAGARKYLIEIGKRPEAAVKAMPPAQVLLLTLATQAREYRDEVYKAGYLPYPEARPVAARAEQRLRGATSEGILMARDFTQGLGKSLLSQARTERKLAALRIVEALRLHAALNGGQLPDRLDQITAVPVPADPLTGKPFEYHRDGNSATLTSRLADEPKTGLRYRITLRKP
jgi:hypothetical protein